MSNHPRWAPPPLSFNASGAERRRRAAEERRAQHEIRCIWNEFFREFHVITGVDSPTGVLAWEDQPEIRWITLGPPTRFTIKRRPGQRRDDFAGLAPRLAAAYDVDAVVVTDLPAPFLTILLVEYAAEAGRPPEGGVPPTLGRLTRRVTPTTAPSGRGVRRHGRLLGSREGRRPFGRPRSWG